MVGPVQATNLDDALSTTFSTTFSTTTDRLLDGDYLLLHDGLRLSRRPGRTLGASRAGRATRTRRARCPRWPRWPLDVADFHLATGCGQKPADDGSSTSEIRATNYACHQETLLCSPVGGKP